MGLFSNDEEVVVQSQALKLMEKTPDIIQNSIKTSIMSVNGDIVPDLINNGLNGLGPKVRQAYIYARDNYTYGLPDGTVVKFEANDSSVASIIQKEINAQIHILVNITDKAKAVYWAKEFMQKDRGWDQETNQVNNPPAFNDRAVYFAKCSCRQKNTLLITYYYTVHRQKVYFDETVPSLTPIDTTKEYVHVIYQLKNSAGAIVPKQYFWMYEINTGVYPELEIPRDESIGSPFLPIVPLRLWGYDQTFDKTSNFYKTARLTLKKLTLDFGMIGKQLHNNPDIQKINHAYIVFGCHLADENQSVKKYIHAYFRQLHNRVQFTREDYLNWKEGNSFNMQPSYTGITFTDATLAWQINYLWSTLEVYEDKMGTVGECTVTFEKGTSPDGSMFYDDVVVARKQISKTQVEKIQICGLQHYSHIHDGEGVSYNARAAFNKQDNACFILPIDMQVANGLGIYVMHDLVQDSAHMVLNSYEEIEIKWYQKGIFKVVFVIVMAVFAFYTGQWQAFFSSLGSMAFAAAAMIFVKTIAISIVINVALTAIAKQVSPELAMLISVIAIITGVSSKLPFGITAIDAASLGIQLTSKSISFETEDLMSDFEESYDYWNGMFDDLDIMREEMYDPDFDPLTLASMRNTPIALSETWSEYYRRVINIPNNQYSVLQSIEQYAEAMTSLPTLNESITEINKRYL